MSKWYDDKDSVKEVFDGIRNFLYCGVLFYAGVVNLYESSTITVVKYLYSFIGVVFCLCAIYLMVINYVILFKSFVSRRKSLLSYVACHFIFSLVVIQFALFALTHESEQVKLADGQSVGEVKVPRALVPDLFLDKVN